jgi:hypothetical protein
MGWGRQRLEADGLMPAVNSPHQTDVPWGSMRPEGRNEVNSRSADGGAYWMLPGVGWFLIWAIHRPVFLGSVRSFVYEGSVKVDIALLGQLADPGKRAPN